MLVSRGEKIYQGLNNVLLGIVALTMLIPVWHVLMYSVSEPNAYMPGLVFWPNGFSLTAYQAVLGDALILGSFVNSVIVTSSGTLLNILLLLLGGYVLSVKQLKGRMFFQYLMFFTMIFSGGLVPYYLIVRSLGLINSLLALIIPTALGAGGVFIMRTFIQQLPDSLSESGRIDGASEYRILFQIIVPLTKPAMAVLGLQHAVGLWNDWFNCIIFINSTSKLTLQPILRQILFTVGSIDYFGYDPALSSVGMPKVVTMAVVMVAVVPVAIIYPFLQKYFIKGIMIGSVKG